MRAGFYSRIAADAGAGRVVGVDASAEMLDHARVVTADAPSVEYLLSDVATMPSLGEFDIVIAGFLLNNARSREELAAMSRRIAEHLAPGGRFVGSVPNSDFDRRRPLDPKYGVTYDGPLELPDGHEFAARLHHVDPPLTLRAFFWRSDTYVAALAEAGIAATVHPWLPSPAALERFGPDFWTQWTANPLCALVTGQHAAGTTA